MNVMNYPPYTTTRTKLLLERNIRISPNSIVEGCDIGRDTTIWHHCNLYKCLIGDNCEIGSFVEIGRGVVIGDNTRILPFAFIPPGVVIGSNCFIGPHVSFSNDSYPAGTHKQLFEVEKTLIGNYVAVGAGSILLPGITIADGVMIGSGSLVTKSILEENVIAYGHPATVRRKRALDE
jgi:acetyltransferase-like isoleucine patch superfamily enzyme